MADSTKKSRGRRLGEGMRSVGELGRDAMTKPGALPGRAHGWFRRWFRKVWELRGGGLYAVGFAVAFLWFEISEFVTEDVYEFASMSSPFSGELIGLVVQFFIDSLVNTAKAFAWPAWVIAWRPPVGIIALAAAFILFPRFLKPPIERWLFGDEPASGNATTELD